MRTFRKQNIWIWNHYATNTYFEKGGRHYWFGKYLIENHYKPTIFCATTIHNSDEFVEAKGEKYISYITENIPYVFVKTPIYKGNGIKRILNMMAFYRNIFKVAKEYADLNGKPDVILASSVHPLTLIAGIKIAKKMGIPCICEVRDLWPESFVAYGIMGKNNPIIKLLYAGEKWIYKKADKLIFTMEGGKDYIVEKGWDKEIDMSKIHHINNGIDMEEFNYNKAKYTFTNDDLDDDKTYKVIYTGSLRAANNQIWELLKTAELFNSEECEDIKFFIYGDGPERDLLEKYCDERFLSNVYLKGRVEKKYIPYILSKADINILNCTSFGVLKYGGSQNKLFEYLASGHPIITAEATEYSVVRKYNCGIARDFKDALEIKEAILELKNLAPNQLAEMQKSIKATALKYDFRKLTNELIEIIETGREEDEEKDNDTCAAY